MTFKLRGKHGIGDFLNDTFSMVPKIWKGALPVSAISLLPGIALFSALLALVTGWIKPIIETSGALDLKEDPSAIFRGLGPLAVLYALVVVVLYFGQAFQKAFIVAQASAAIDGRDPSLAELLSASFKKTWVRVTVQDAVVQALKASIALAIIGFLFFPFLVGKLGDLVRMKGSGGPDVGFILSLILLYLGSILIAAAAAWWIGVMAAVSAPATVLEGGNSFAGIGRSLDLVRGKGWKVFGSMFVVSLVISFGLGIVTGPITFALIIPGYVSLLKESLSGGTPSPESIISMLSSMSWGLGVTMLISGVVKGCLWPSFLTLLYRDLCIRAGEREAWEDPSPRLATIEEMPIGHSSGSPDLPQGPSLG
jgi:hypothetical protein